MNILAFENLLIWKIYEYDLNWYSKYETEAKESVYKVCKNVKKLIVVP
jgi:hypothetical protein